jgi:heme A synthase
MLLFPTVCSNTPFAPRNSLPAHRSRLASRLATATTLLTFALIVIGSIVRTTGSGLACPDWPLCEGRIIPRFQFNVMVEWLHRLVALGVSLGLVATAAVIFSTHELRARLGGLVALAGALLAVQVLLGALTVWKLLHPAVVSSHLGVALLFFVALLSIALGARALAREGGPPERHAAAPRPAGLLPSLALVTGLVYVQAVLGAVVSTSHAGLACPDWPACNGTWLPPLHSLQGVHMLHRYVAYALVAAVTWVALRARGVSDEAVRAGAGLALGLVIAQVALGVLNVWLALPVWVVALHLGTATALLATMFATAWRVGSMPAPAARRAAEAGA